MFTEREVCQHVIDAACELRWPRDRLLVQILDDSTDEVTRDRIEDKVLEWRERGVNIVCRWRSNRSGYKAGAMAESLTGACLCRLCAALVGWALFAGCCWLTPGAAGCRELPGALLLHRHF